MPRSSTHHTITKKTRQSVRRSGFNGKPSQKHPRYWLSWNEPVDSSGDSRPRKWPLPKSVIKFWRSGEAMDGSYHTLVAVVDAKDPSAARRQVERAGWTPSQWRFVEEKPTGWMPEGGRFV
jgi:hypothetical protein